MYSKILCWGIPIINCLSSQKGGGGWSGAYEKLQQNKYILFDLICSIGLILTMVTDLPDICVSLTISHIDNLLGINIIR